MNKLLFSFFLLGLSLGIGPCLATCGPLLISYIAGTQKDSIKGIGAYIIFSLSRIFVYVLVGLSVFLIGEFAPKYFFSSVQRYIFILGGIFISAVGFLIAIGRNHENKSCRRFQEVLLKKDTKTIILLGVFMGIAPCLPFISAASYIGLVSKAWTSSLLYSLAFGIGTAISPLLILAALAGLIPKILINQDRLSTIFNFICGVILIFLGVNLILKTF